MDLQIRGRRAFVSGASSGIGREIALLLAKEGCDLTVQGRDKLRTEETAHEVEAHGVKSFAVCGDLATDEGCQAVAERTLAQMGDVEILVNNVGLLIRKDMPLWSDIPVQTWIDSYQVNFMSTLRMTMHFLPGIKKNMWGRIINISTAGATTTPTTTEYTVAKAALNKLTADMSKDVGQYNCTCNGIAPGTTHSGAVDEWLTGIAQREGWPGDFSDWEARYLAERSPEQSIRSFARPQEIAALAAFLASPHAAHLTGVTIRVDGGHNSAVYL